MCSKGKKVFSHLEVSSVQQTHTQFSTSAKILKNKNFNEILEYLKNIKDKSKFLYLKE